MSSINPHFTFNYTQPEDYRFSHDSVFLARHVFEIIKEQNLKYDKILDLCAGCGIVGLDLLFHLKKSGFKWPDCIDFVDVQSVYEPYYKANVTLLQNHFDQKLNERFIIANYQDLLFNDPILTYDMIVCNPPYFRKDQGALSKSEFKNRCRFFIDSDFENLIRGISVSLNPSGHAFVLLKSLKQHNVSIKNEFLNLQTDLEIKHISVIRNTDLYQLTKKEIF